MNMDKLASSTNDFYIKTTEAQLSIFHSKKNNSKSYIAIFFIMAMLATSTIQAANLLFKSNFGPGVSLGSVYGLKNDGTDTNAWQDITGTDQETGFSWPIKALGANFSGIQLYTYYTVNSSTINDYISNEINQVPGPNGKNVYKLFQNVKIKPPVGQSGSQAPLLIGRPWNIGDLNSLYISYWFYYPSDFPSKLDNTVTAGNWRSQFEFKTGGYNNTWTGDYRIVINVLKGADGNLYWQTNGDNQANSGFSKITYWSEANKAVPVPVGKWFKFEVYWKRSGSSDGRFWATVDGQEIVDHYGPNMGDYNLPITRIMVNNAYSGGYATVESHSTGLEIWDGFPCGDGISCVNNADTTAPSAPASLTASTVIFNKPKNKYAQISLSWGASTDSVGVTGYKVYRNGKEITTTTTTSFVDKITGSPTGALYDYTVKAIDSANNISQSSNQVSVVY